MTKDNIHEYWPLLEALRNGKTVQLSLMGGWVDAPDPVFNCSPDKYRIKPEPTLRPWTRLEVPLGAWARHKDISEDVFLITGRTPSKVILVDDRVAFEDMLRFYEYSTTEGKSWAPCGR